MFVHMMRVFFTGAFRKPREINWLFGFLLFVLGMFDRLHRLLAPGRPALRHRCALHRGRDPVRCPIVGTYLSFFLFGGEFPGDDFVPRFYPIHVLLLPGHHARPGGRPPDPGLLPQAHAVPGPRQDRTRTSSACPFCRSTWPRPAASSSWSSASSRCIAAIAPINPIWSTAPTGRTRCPPAPSPTGTWASPRA